MIESRFPSDSWSILTDSFIFYTTTLLLLSYFGLGISALLLPRSLKRFGWLLAPYLGYSLLIVISSLTVSLGASIRVALLCGGAVATAALACAFSRGALSLRDRRARWWLLVPAAGLPSFALTAITMVHNGTMAYIGPNFDPFLHITLAEWLKNNGAPLFASFLPLTLAPGWNSCIPPFTGWLADGAHLDYAIVFGHDTYFPFHRGTLYVASSLGILLDWDVYRVLRPTLAFMLSLVPPMVFLFARQLIGAGIRTSAFAALLMGLNSTIFFWVSIAHPGQSGTMFMAPLVCLATLEAVQDRGKLSVVGAALILSAGLVTYYQGQPVVLGLVGAGLAWLLLGSSTRMEMILRLVAIGLCVLLFALPDHIRLFLDWRDGALIQVTGWGNPGFPALSDALGTTLDGSALDLVAGQGQVPQTLLTFFGFVTMVATGVSVLAVILGTVRGRGARMGIFRVMLLAALVAMWYLRFVSGFTYAVVKSQAIVTFLFVVAIALGMDLLIERLPTPRVSYSGFRDLRPSPRALLLSLPPLLVIGVAVANLALGAYAFWKPVGNIWNPRMWEATAFTRLLPARETVKLSSGILVDPEALWMTLYALRNQLPLGPFTYHGTAVTKMVDNSKGAAGTDGARPGFTLFGASEVATSKGFLPSDRLWSGSLLRLYRTPAIGEVAVADPVGAQQQLPSSLPARLSAQWPSEPNVSAGTLILTLAAEQPAVIELSRGGSSWSLQLEKGVSVRSLSVAASEPIGIAIKTGGPAQLLSATARADARDRVVQEDYPAVLATSGTSNREGARVSTRLTYLDVAIPASHSIDIFDVSGQNRVGWFKLPTSPDGQLRDIRLVLDPATLENELWMDGAAVSQPVSTRPARDGEFVAYFSIEYGAAKPVRIPIYSYVLADGVLSEVKSYPLLAIWDGRSELSNWDDSAGSR